MRPVFIVYSFIILVVEFNKKRSRAFADVKLSDSCKKLLEDFAFASADFMLCTLQNARPVQICCSCVEEYNRVLEVHDKIIQVEKNSSCNERLINQDRLEVVESGFSYANNLWSRGQCQNCFEDKHTLSNTTKEFIQLYSNTNACLKEQYNPTNKSYNPDVCLICSDQYYKMSKFYVKLKETSGNGNVCVDIVDSVNVTQHLWSNVLHCGETVLSVEVPLIAISTAFFIIPVIFYLCAWKFTKDRPAAVFNQNRVSQRFRESGEGSRISN